MSSPKPYSSGVQTPDEGATNPIFSDADYTPVLTNWFTAKPYGFRFAPKEGGFETVMYLPINPSNISILTNFATNITPTIYGTVEEHSPVRYYDIVIEGTTGISPKYVTPAGSNELIVAQKGRTAFAIHQFFNSEGFFAKTLQTAENVTKSVKNLIGNNDQSLAITGLQLDQTGYYAFHNLYRFLLKYKKNASGSEKGNENTPRTSNAPPLVFFNYKDNNEYSVVIKSFTLRRDKENPMMYFYSISMRGYNLTKINESERVNKNSEITELLTNLGLDGVQGSLFLSKAKEIASQTKEVLGSVANGLNQLGR